MNLNTRIRNILGGQAIGWLDVPERDFEILRVCSYSEFYNATSAHCEPCLRGKNTKNWLTDNSTGTGPFFSESVQSTECFDCGDLDSMTTSAWKLYLKANWLCSNKDYFTGFNTSLRVHDYERYDPNAEEIGAIVELEKNDEIKGKKDDVPDPVLAGILEKLKTLVKGQKNIMLTVIIGFSCCCCTVFLLFICCKKKASPPMEDELAVPVSARRSSRRS